MEFDTTADRRAARAAAKEQRAEFRVQADIRRARLKGRARFERWVSWRKPAALCDLRRRTLERWPVSGPQVVAAIDAAPVAQQFVALERLEYLLNLRGKWLPDWLPVVLVVPFLVLYGLVAQQFGWSLPENPGVLGADMLLALVVGVVWLLAAIVSAWSVTYLVEVVGWRWRVEAARLQGVVDAATDPSPTLSDFEKDLVSEQVRVESER